MLQTHKPTNIYIISDKKMTHFPVRSFLPNMTSFTFLNGAVNFINDIEEILYDGHAFE